MSPAGSAPIPADPRRALPVLLIALTVGTGVVDAVTAMFGGALTGALLARRVDIAAAIALAAVLVGWVALRAVQATRAHQGAGS